MLFDFIIWNADPGIFKFGPFEIRWYGLFFALAFYLGYVIFTKFFKKEGETIELLDKLTLYMAVGTIVGARLGHCLFYEPAYYLSNPVEILKIWKGGLASHGAAIGILIALYMFSKKFKKPYLWIVDRIVIVVALAGFFIRSGNLMNSEIYGEPTYSNYGYVFARSYGSLFDDEDNIKSIKYEKLPYDTLRNGRFVPVKVKAIFDKKVRNQDLIKQYVQSEMNYKISRNVNSLVKDIVLFPEDDFNFDIEKKGVNFVATFTVWGVPKHPTQIYEALAYLIIFVVLMWLYYKNEGKILGGYIFGLFMLTVFSARFIIETIKENQVPFEDKIALNMGQILSIPLIIAGIIFIIYSIKTKKVY